MLARMSEPAAEKHNAQQLRTVGTPAYLTQTRSDFYVSEARRSNAKLWGLFPELYEEVFGVLTRFLGEKPALSLRAAIPGFHVIRNDSAFPRYEGGIPHIDCSHLSVPLFATLPMQIEQLSFTVLLSEADSEIGLEYWPEGTPQSEAAESQATFMQYEQGELVLFGGDLVHRIAPFERVRERVTLQGHLVRFNGLLVAYW